MAVVLKAFRGVILMDRFPASWRNAGGRISGIPRYDGKYIDWLKTLVVNGEPLTEEEVDEIYRYTQELNCGKLELEISAKEFLKEGA